MIKAITTNKSPKAIGPYSQAIIAENMIYISGQIPIDPQTGNVVSDDIEKQTKQVLENLKNILIEAGSNLSSVVKTTVYIKDMNSFPKINEIYASYFKEPFPSRACVEVSRLPKDVLIEIEAVAFITFIK